MITRMIDREERIWMRWMEGRSRGWMRRVEAGSIGKLPSENNILNLTKKHHETASKLYN